MEEVLGEKGFLSHLWEFLPHRMIPKEQKEPAMAVPGDLAEPGKVDPALCLPQTLLGLRLWPFRLAGPRAVKQVGVSQKPLDMSVECVTGHTPDTF